MTPHVKDEKAETEQLEGKRAKARVMELEEETDVLRSKLLRAHSENTKRERSLEKRLWDARDALSGCVKLEQQERTVAGATRLQAVNAELEKANRRLSEQKVDLVVVGPEAIAFAREREVVPPQLFRAPCARTLNPTAAASAIHRRWQPQRQEAEKYVMLE